MSEFNSIVDPDDGPAPAPVAEAVPEEVAAEPAPQAVPAERPSETHAAIIALRRELQEMKPLAEKAQQYKDELDAARPYAEFLRNNPHLLNPPPAPVAPAPQLQDDPELVELARTLELYNAQTGQPDVKRAETIRNLTRKEAQQIAQQTMAPVQERTHEQQAAANVDWMRNLADADGNRLDDTFIVDAVKALYGNIPKADASRLLADRNVAEVIGYNALGRQAAAKKRTPAPAALPAALHVEQPGGSAEVVLSDGSRRLARMTGRTENDWQKAAARYVPNRANSLE